MFSFCLSSILSPSCLCLLHKSQLFVFLFPLNSLAGLEDYRKSSFCLPLSFYLLSNFSVNVESLFHAQQFIWVLKYPIISVPAPCPSPFTQGTPQCSVPFLLVFPSVPKVQTKWLCLFIFLYPFPDEMSLEETRIFLSLVLFLLWSHG